MPPNVSDILYFEINNIGREKIRMDVSANIDTSETYCQEILMKCTKTLGPLADDETLATLCEALLHFMLTASVLPSERKVRFKEANLDVVIPSVKILQKNQEKALIIQIIKNNDDTHKIIQAESVQLLKENIWIVSSKRLQTNYRNYHLSEGQIPFYRIVRDIHAFVASKRLGGLKMLHGE